MGEGGRDEEGGKGGREGGERREGWGGRKGWEGGKGGREGEEGREGWGEREREEGMYTCLLSSVSTGFVLCLLSLGCGVVLGLFDKRAERITRRKEEGSGAGRRREKKGRHLAHFFLHLLKFPLSRFHAAGKEGIFP